MRGGTKIWSRVRVGLISKNTPSHRSLRVRDSLTISHKCYRPTCVIGLKAKSPGGIYSKATTLHGFDRLEQKLFRVVMMKINIEGQLSPRSFPPISLHHTSCVAIVSHIPTKNWEDSLHYRVYIAELLTSESGDDKERKQSNSMTSGPSRYIAG